MEPHDGIPDRPHLIFWLELKSKIFVLRFFPQLKPFGVLGHTPEPNILLISICIFKVHMIQLFDNYSFRIRIRRLFVPYPYPFKTDLVSNFDIHLLSVSVFVSAH